MSQVRTTKRKTVFGESYFALVRQFPLRRIQTAKELDEAIEVIDSLLDRDRLDAGEKEYLDILSDLVERYENEHDPIEPASDAAMLRFLIDQKGVTQAQTATGSGLSESRISEVLNGKRRLTRTQLERVAAHFGVAPAVFTEASPTFRGT